MKRSALIWIRILILGLILPACARNISTAPATGNSTGSLRVLATTTIVADVVAQVGGDRIQLDSLLPPGVDPHSFEATPQEVVKISEASLIFINGAGLETFLNPLLESAGAQATVVAVSDGVQLLAGTEDLHSEDETGGQQTDPEGDPHTWFDPNNVIIWTENIAAALSQADPQEAETYQANAERYKERLRELDRWIQSQVEQIPPERRLLVTDHTSLTYYAARYGFEQVGAVIPGYSTLAEPSAQDLARLEDQIRSLGAPAVFVGEASNPVLSRRVSQDTSIQLVQLYNGALSTADGPAPTYIDLMRYDTGQIVAALTDK